jgi:hypothetical protein
MAEEAESAKPATDDEAEAARKKFAEFIAARLARLESFGHFEPDGSFVFALARPATWSTQGDVARLKVTRLTAVNLARLGEEPTYADFLAVAPSRVRIEGKAKATPEQVDELDAEDAFRLFDVLDYFFWSSRRIGGSAKST